MATEVVMPQMGESIAEGTITKWLKNVGDHVERDEPLFEISTDKVDAEIPSPAAGTLTDIKHKEGETVEVNTVVAVLDGDGAKSEPAAPEASAEQPATTETAEQAQRQPKPLMRQIKRRRRRQNSLLQKLRHRRLRKSNARSRRSPPPSAARRRRQAVRLK